MRRPPSSRSSSSRPAAASSPRRSSSPRATRSASASTRGWRRSPTPRRPPTSQRLAKRTVELSDPAIDDMEALEPPSELEDDFKKFVASLKRQRDLTKEIGDAAGDGRHGEGPGDRDQGPEGAGRVPPAHRQDRVQGMRRRCLMARFGVLTGGGDCPGLNAVIRAIVRRGMQHGHEFFGYRYGWAGVLAGRGRRADRGGHARDPAPRRDDPRDLADEPVQGGERPRARARVDGAAQPRRADPDRRRGHARRRRAAVRGRHRRRRRAQDDRQRPRGHRLHVRLPDRGADRHRRDRPPAHDGGVAQPRDRRRGDGAHRGLDRLLLRDGRRRRRDPRARAAVRHRGGLRAGPQPPRERALVLDRRGRRGGDAEGRRGQVRVRGRDGRLRPRAPGRDRGPPRARDRGSAPASSRG